MKKFFRSLVLIFFVTSIIKASLLASQEFMLESSMRTMISTFSSFLLSDLLVLGVVAVLGVLSEKLRSFFFTGVFFLLAAGISFLYLLETFGTFLFHVELNLSTIGQFAQDAVNFFPKLVRGGLLGFVSLFALISFFISGKKIEKAVSHLGSLISIMFCLSLISGILS